MTILLGHEQLLLGLLACLVLVTCLAFVPALIIAAVGGALLWSIIYPLCSNASQPALSHASQVQEPA